MLDSKNIVKPGRRRKNFSNKESDIQYEENPSISSTAINPLHCFYTVIFKNYVLIKAC